jgi:pyruvate,orthophosphate dikinase
LKGFLDLPGYGDIVGTYSELPGQIYDSVEDEKLKHAYKLIFLFHSMNITGLSTIHEDTLREINRDISWLMEHEDIDHIQLLIQQTFSILNKSVDKFPDTVLKTVLNMGGGVYLTDESDLVNYFNQQVVQLGFQTPEFRGVSDEWQIQSNLSHIQNIRTWMELITLKPRWSKKLLSSLIIHLSLSGVLIKDTDLFPRDITGFLNSSMQPVYNLAKQLMRLFPAYFNEIGAEGQLRDISTRIDEICRRKDKLVHFLRKQSHVESSNKIISLIEVTLEFWRTKSREVLKPFIPPNIYEEVAEAGPYIDGVNEVLTYIYENRGYVKTSDILSMEEDYFAEITGKFPDENKLDIERVALAISFYKLLNQKYCISSCEIDDSLARVQSSIPLNSNELRDALSIKGTFERLNALLAYLEKLKDIILSPEEFEIREDIYHKRHIAAEIPSMYGSYHETKFDALGLTFRLESMVNTLFEELIEGFDFGFITQATVHRIHDYLKLFHRALTIDGIHSEEFEQQLDLLDKSMNISLVSFTQYLDIFRGFTQIIRNLVSDHFNNVHKENLLEISGHLPVEKLLPKYVRESSSRGELFHTVSEIFLRDAIASSLGIQRLDLFLTRIINTLHEQAEKLSPDKHYLLLTYNPRKIVTPISKPYSDLLDVIHLGNKSLNIIRMKNLGLPVPPGFVITTEVFRCRELIENYSPANKNFREIVHREMTKLEKITGRSFGSADNSLLVSVRSGSAVSQPGMMDSYLNVGMNEEIVRGIIRETGNEWFAWDSYRRFLQSYGMSYGIARDEFDAIIDQFKSTQNILLKKEFTPAQMKEVTMAYKQHIQEKSLAVEESPVEQLYIAITKVLNSWDSDKARTYRKIMGISDDWGTAVTVQPMVFGNISEQSGSGVLFTHSPKFSLDKLRPWGDYTIGNQGEDVVSGLVSTYPISVHQAKIENRPEAYSLERRFPEIYRSLRDYAKELIYDNQWAPQDIEFTFEGPRRENLYMLQTRNMEMRERKTVPSFESAAEMTGQILGHGIGVGGGAMSGRTVFCLDDIAGWKKDEPGTPLILVRGDTVPEDIKEISAADGLLTARGGATSHAAIVANRLEKTCVVGCRDLVCMEKDRKFIMNDTTVNAGDYISIDGSEGAIYSGKMKVSGS